MHLVLQLGVRVLDRFVAPEEVECPGRVHLPHEERPHDHGLGVGGRGLDQGRLDETDAGVELGDPVGEEREEPEVRPRIGDHALVGGPAVAGLHRHLVEADRVGHAEQEQQDQHQGADDDRDHFAHGVSP